jgi:transcriptional regulator with XRE-family HTH domain
MDSGDRQALGQRLSTARVALGLTQLQLAVRAGVHARTVAGLERGATQRPHQDTVRRLARALGVSLTWLQTGQAMPAPTHDHAGTRFSMAVASDPQIGHRLRTARLAWGLSQEQLSARSGVSAHAIGLIERGQVTRLRFGTLIALTNALDIEPSWLLSVDPDVPGGP